MLIPHHYTAPACWAPYLINGDDSGLDAADIAAADAFVARIGMGSPVSCEEGEAAFRWHHDAHPECPLGADCEVYVFLAEGTP